MKAKDLAALAALGVAGYAAYNKFGKKDDEPKTRGKLGESQSANDGTAGETENYSNEGRGKNAKFTDEDYSNEGRNAKFANEDYSNEGRGKTAPDFSNEGRGKVKKEIEYPLFPRPVAKKETVAKPVVKRNKEDYSNEGRNSKAPVAQPAGYEGVVSAAELGSQGFNSNLPVAQSGSPYSDVVPKGDLGSQDFRSNAKRIFDANQANGAANPASLLTDAYGNLSRSEQHVDVTKKLANAAPLIAKSSALANVSHATQAAAMARKRAADQAAKMNDMARLDELNKSNFAGGRRAAGGMVKKMASGGLASSRMSSKPKQSTASSRGDGIAQRGKTRGQMR